MPAAAQAPAQFAARSRRARRTIRHRRAYPHWFYLPVGIVFVAIFVVPTAMAFFYSLTRWTLFDWEFIGLENFRQFFREPALTNGLRNTFIYAVVTSGLEGRARDGPRPARDVADQAQGDDPLDRVLSRAGQHGGCRHHVQGDDAPDQGPDQHDDRRHRHHRAEVADRPADRLAVGRPRRRLEGRRAGDGDLHRRHRLDPVGAAASRCRSTAAGRGRGSATSSCR